MHLKVFARGKKIKIKCSRERNYFFTACSFGFFCSHLNSSFAQLSNMAKIFITVFQCMNDQRFVFQWDIVKFSSEKICICLGLFTYFMLRRINNWHGKGCSEHGRWQLNKLSKRINRYKRWSTTPITDQTDKTDIERSIIPNKNISQRVILNKTFGFAIKPIRPDLCMLWNDHQLAWASGNIS